MPPQIPGERHPRFQQDDFGGGTPPPSPYDFAADMQPERSGPDWEDTSQPLFGRWWSTVSAVFSRPTETFRNLRLDGGIGSPLVFGIIGGTIGSIASTLWSTLFNGLGLAAQIGAGGSEEEAAMAGAQVVMSLVFGVCLAPVFIAIGLFITTGITHVMLMLLGGAQKGFETTFRCTSYVSGALSLLNIIPMCGGCVYLVWYIIGMATALSNTHEISMGKAYAAVLIPILLCTTVVVGGFFLLFGAAVLASA
jgi:hypothetical protein